MKNSTVTIRMGAARWDVSIQDVGTFDLRSMSRTERGQFHGRFMSAVRKSMRKAG